MAPKTEKSDSNMNYCTQVNSVIIFSNISIWRIRPINLFVFPYIQIHVENRFSIIFLLQIISSLGVCFGHMVIGTLVGYPTIAIPQLKNEINPNLQLDDSLRSWFAPTFSFCAIPLMMPGGFLSSKFGRRKILLFTMPFIMAGWGLIGFAQNKIMIFSGRILSCSFACLSCCSISVYISETVHPNIRGSDGFG